LVGVAFRICIGLQPLGDEVVLPEMSCFLGAATFERGEVVDDRVADAGVVEIDLARLLELVPQLRENDVRRNMT